MAWSGAGYSEIKMKNARSKFILTKINTVVSFSTGLR